MRSRPGLLVVLVLVGLIAAVMGGYTWGQRVEAAGGQPVEPGTEGDPLVAKSYVDDKVGQIDARLGQLNDKLGQVEARFGTMALQVVELPKGKVLLVEGGAEVVLRAGKATAIGSKLGGVADLSAGVDLATGASLSPNHLLVIPRSDGRGLKAVTDCVVLVRGGFTVQ